MPSLGVDLDTITESLSHRPSALPLLALFVFLPFLGQTVGDPTHLFLAGLVEPHLNDVVAAEVGPAEGTGQILEAPHVDTPLVEHMTTGSVPDLVPEVELTKTDRTGNTFPSLLRRDVCGWHHCLEMTDIWCLFRLFIGW